MQKWCDLVHSERSKVHYYQPKNQQLKGLYINKQILFAIFFFLLNRDVHVNKLLHFIRESVGQPPEAKASFKKQNGGFSLQVNFFNLCFTFWQGSLNPQNYEFAPQIP